MEELDKIKITNKGPFFTIKATSEKKITLPINASLSFSTFNFNAHCGSVGIAGTAYLRSLYNSLINSIKDEELFKLICYERIRPCMNDIFRYLRDTTGGNIFYLNDVGDIYNNDKFINFLELIFSDIDSVIITGHGRNRKTNNLTSSIIISLPDKDADF